MNQTEYLALKKTLVQGSMPERTQFLESFSFGQLCEFGELLELDYADRLQAPTWQLLVRLLAIKGSGYAFKVDGPVANPNCEKCHGIGQYQLHVERCGHSDPIDCDCIELETVDVLAVQQKQKAASVQG